MSLLVPLFLLLTSSLAPPAVVGGLILKRTGTLMDKRTVYETIDEQEARLGYVVLDPEPVNPAQVVLVDAGAIAPPSSAI